MKLSPPVFRLIVLFVLMSIMACGGSNNGSNTTGANTVTMGGSVQGKALSLTTEVTTIAGSTSVDGTGTGAAFNQPMGITKAGSSLYVVDQVGCTVRKIDASGAVTTVAGQVGRLGYTDGLGSSARFSFPTGITSSGQYLYVTDTNNSTIRKINTVTGEVSTFAGSQHSVGSTDGIGTQATFGFPQGITTDGTNLYVVDSFNARIRKIVIATGEVTTLAGSERASQIVDGVGAAARFINPEAITTDGTNVFVSDSAYLRKIVIATGAVTTVASSAHFTSLVTDGAYIYGIYGFDNCIVRLQINGGAVETYAGKSGAEGAGAVDGPVTSARFYRPQGLFSDGGNIYVSDTGNHMIRKIDFGTNMVTTVAGSARTDGVGSAARFYSLGEMTTDGANLYVTASNEGKIRKISIATGSVTTLPGAFSYPTGITRNGNYLYVADVSSIAKVGIATGEITTLAGSSANYNHVIVDGIGTAAGFSSAKGITTDGISLYVTDNCTVRRIDLATGAVTTIAGVAGTAGSADGTGSAATFSQFMGGITTDGRSLYVADYDRIRKIDKFTGRVTTLPGAGTLFAAEGITTDGTNLYVTAFGLVDRINPATGAVTTVAGTREQGASDGVGAAARFNLPYGITTNGEHLYVADGRNGLIRQIQ